MSDSPEKIKALGDSVEAVVGETKATAAKVDELANELRTEVTALKASTEADVQRLAKEGVALRQTLANSYGKQGAEDWINDMAKFLRGVDASKRGAKVEGEILGSGIMEVVEKAAVDFVTINGGDNTAGYLIPDILKPGIRELMDIYGNVLPRFTSVTAPAGHQVLLNEEAARPVATFRGTQLSTITLEATPMKWAQDGLISELCGTYIEIANELIRSPYVNFGAVALARILKAISWKVETSVINGTTGGGDPSDGIIPDATAQSAIASMTFALLVSFLQECIADNSYAYDTSRNCIFMTPADAMALATQAVGTGELTGMLVWGNPRTGTPTTLLGYELIVHPALDNGTNKYVVLGDPSAVTLVNDGGFTVDISDQAGSAFVENASILRAFNHYDWNIGIAAEWHAAVVTA